MVNVRQYNDCVEGVDFVKSFVKKEKAEKYVADAKAKHDSASHKPVRDGTHRKVIMTKKELKKMIRKSLKNVVEGNETDTAIKTYFYPLSGALFTKGEFENFTEADLLTVKSDKHQWVIEETARRLGKVVKKMKLDEIYLSVYVYGGIATCVVDVNEKGVVGVYYLKNAFTVEA